MQARNCFFVALWLVSAPPSLAQAPPTSDTATANAIAGPAPAPAVPPYPEGNIPWEGLTPAQQARVRAKYENMPASEEPPYPLHGEQRLYEQVQAALAEYGQDTICPGQWHLSVTVAPDGQVSALSIVQAPDKDAAMAVGHALLATRFKPGRCGGTACQMDFPIDFHVACQIVNRF